MSVHGCFWMFVVHGGGTDNMYKTVCAGIFLLLWGLLNLEFFWRRRQILKKIYCNIYTKWIPSQHFYRLPVNVNVLTICSNKKCAALDLKRWPITTGYNMDPSVIRQPANANYLIQCKCKWTGLYITLFYLNTQSAWYNLSNIHKHIHTLVDALGSSLD